MPRPHHPRAKVFETQPAFAACQWISGKPILSLDIRKLRILALRRRCWLCGYPVIGAGYQVVTEEDVCDRYGDLHTEGSGPIHLSCALYSVAACPFLRYGRSRRRITGDAYRGVLSIKGFGEFGVFFPPADPDGVFMLFGFFNPTEMIAITNQTRVADLYEQALIADAATGFTETQRLYWTDATADVHRLGGEWFDAWQKLLAWAQTSVITVNGHDYRGHAIDQSTMNL
ncbi:hypothetical protein [Mycobacterium montefiorense]|uniref:hypothetical protein n=1 Tax=Mycobacterium montefiorense TaxID=154654 RepID=UPI0021F3606D|nr:hypothetical protein [Mycobacterium montefiorense]MCV7428065.1 hypothetical protein [Mycobacterium montefiorense]